PETQAERRAALIGWVYSPFRAGNLFADTLNLPASNSEIELSIYDGAVVSERELLYRSTGSPGTAPYEITQTIPFAGRSWTVVARRTEDFRPDSNRQIIPFIIAGGLGATLLLFGASYAQTRAMAEAQRAREQLRELNTSLEERVEERTAQLESARSAL